MKKPARRAPPSLLFVFTTVGNDEQAEKVARELVERRLAACVNALPGVRSIYRWKGAVCEDREIFLVVKTTASRFPAVQKAIRELHPYDLPEIVAVRLDRVEEKFGKWIAESCAAERPRARR